MRNFLLPRHPGQRLKSFYSHTDTERGYTLWAEAAVHHTAEADIPEADIPEADPSQYGILMEYFTDHRSNCIPD